MSPWRCILEIRLQDAARMLEAGADNVEQTTRAVDYRDVDAFRKHVKPGQSIARRGTIRHDEITHNRPLKGR